VERGRILVVDDEEGIRFTFRNFLEEEGYRVTTAADYDLAMAAVSEGEFDLAFVDIILEGRSGIDLLRDLKGSFPSIEVVIVTGAPTIESASNALRLGALDYVVKPVRQDALIRSADMAFRHKALIDAKEAYRRNIEAIFRSVKDAIITVDQQLNLVEANHAAEQLCGIRREEWIGKPFHQGGLPCDRSCLGAVLDTVAQGKAVELRKVECTCPERPPRVVSVTATPLIDDRARASGGVLVIRDETRLVALERSLRTRQESGSIVGRSEPIRKVLSLIEALGDVETSVLITGESGTGKELVADALHAAGRRRKRILVKVNCSALSESLLESELFGHVRGAFTGADRNKVGRFERADGGTIFLDEIGDITPRMQLRFLRVLESKQFERVGDATPVTADVRVIAATNRNLRDLVARGDFREDLYYRLKVFEIHMPPLRERRDDIPLLVQHFIRDFNLRMDRDVRGVSDAVMELLLGHDWPGNVRELENALEHAFVLCRGDFITPNHLPAELTKEVREVPGAAPDDGSAAPFPADRILPLDEVESRYLAWAMGSHGGDNSSLAQKLGLSERTFYRRLRSLRSNGYSEG
jgi:two-component system, NtrC family, response regulator HydG